MPLFTVAAETLARNPVARAVARRRMESAVRDFLLVVYTMPDGSEQTGNVQVASMALAVAIRLEHQAGRPDSPEARVMTGAMSALAQCSERGFIWRERDAVAVDAGLTRALTVLRSASAHALHDAWMYVKALERG